MRNEWVSGKRTLAQLARLLNTTPSFLWYIFKGHKTPTKKKRDEMLGLWKNRAQ